MHPALLNCSTTVLDGLWMYSLPNASELNAISMSSENRSIIPHPLLNEVPPLKAKYGACFEENSNCSTSVTHQSFSMAFGVMPDFI